MRIKKFYDWYGLYGFINLIFYKIYTLLFFGKSRLIRYPITVRGKKNIDFGNNLTTGVGCRFEAYENKYSKSLVFGDNIQINDNVHITAMKSIIIGNNVLMASKIYISDCQHGYYDGSFNDSSPLIDPKKRKYKKENIVIEENVWIGEFVSILPGVTIGSGSIIGANSVVNSNIPKNSIAVGSPARVIKKYDLNDKQWKKLK